MSEHFVVEADRRVVGVAVRVRGGFKFFASAADFLEIEGGLFPRLSAINRRIKQIKEALRHRPFRASPRGRFAGKEI